MKTDVKGIERVRPGVLLNIESGSNEIYHAARAKMIEEQRQKDRINNLETKVSSMEDMLKQILQKVSQ